MRTEKTLKTQESSSNSLLTQVLRVKDSPVLSGGLFPEESDDMSHIMPDGSAIYDSTIIAVNRILELNPHLHKRNNLSSANPYDLYNGHALVQLDDKNTLCALLRADFTPRTTYQGVLLKQLVEQSVPTLSFDKIVISDGLIWNRETATLEMDDSEPFSSVS